jgi:glycosyltransferase involved in cell wall biosynthesis
LSASDKLPITLIVLTRNEAATIAQCLDSVPFVADKLVVDCGSTDETRDIAAAHGARVVTQEWLGFGPQRNFATARARYDWILTLDADEELTPELRAELLARLPALMQSDIAGAVLHRRTLYMGKPMRWYRPMKAERIARLYHRERARWTDARVHESLRFTGPVEMFHQAFIHHHNPTLVHKHLKVLRYTELKTHDWLERGKQAPLWTCPFIFVAIFLKDYFLRLGFLDGARGYVVSQIAATQAVYRRLRYFELQQNPQSRELAHKLLREHGIEP